MRRVARRVEFDGVVAAQRGRHGAGFPAEVLRTPLRAAALRYPFAHPSVVSAVVGAADADEVRDNAAHFSHDIPDAMWHALVAEGLLDADVPLPLTAALEG